MKIFVCIKQVPDTETKIKVLPDQSGIDFAGLKWIINPYDEFAIEEALKFREKNPAAQVWALALGPKGRVSESLRTALAMGADEAIVINSPDNLDALMTAKSLASVISTEGGARLVFAGKLSIDMNQSSVPQMVAEFLSIPHVSVVSKLESAENKIVVRRDSDGGAKEIIEILGPAVISANKGLNVPRYASLPGIMKAKKKIIKEVEFSSLNFTTTDLKTTYVNFSLPQDKSPVKLLAGNSGQQVSELIKLLRDEAKVL